MAPQKRSSIETGFIIGLLALIFSSMVYLNTQMFDFNKSNTKDHQELFIKMNDEVIIPGTESDKTNFSNLSVSGGVANLYNAIKLAMKKEK